jgi:serine/threonine protein kinase
MVAAEPSHIGRYTLHGAIASGGMATIHYGRFRNDVGFARTVAIKRLLPHYATDPVFVAMLMDEARLAARIQHPNVVQTLDVIHEGDEVLLVLEYVHGASVGRILRAQADRGQRVPVPIAAAIVAGALHGVHAAHEAKDERGQLLELIHRDLSPDNILVDESGIARVVDFGIAKARGRSQQATRPGGVKGKLAYMAPEQVHGATSRQSDVFSMGIVLWEMLVGDRLFGGAYDGEILAAVLTTKVAKPSKRRPEVPLALENVVLKSLRRVAGNRYATALEMAMAIEASVPIAAASEVATWLQALMADALESQRREVAEIERTDPDAVVGRAAESVVKARGAGARRPRSRPAVVAALAGGLALAGLVYVLAGRTPDEPPRALPPSDPTSSAVATSDPSPPEPSSTAEPSLPPGSAPSSSVAVSGTVSGMVSGTVSGQQPPRVDRRPHPPPARSRECDPPFTLDSRGVRTWKRQCF